MSGEDIEWHGVKPDIYIKTTFKDRLEGKNPQLDAAIEEIMSPNCKTNNFQPF